jgi:uncharacterized protein
MSIFVDTSVWFSVTDRSDSRRDKAKEILQTDEPLVTSDHVLVETWLLLRHRMNRHVADTFWERLRGGIATIEPVSSADLEAAWQIGQLWSGHDFSLADRTSFAVMTRLGIDKAASFDSDFAIFRYGPNRKRAFSILA